MALAPFPSLPLPFAGPKMSPLSLEQPEDVHVPVRHSPEHPHRTQLGSFNCAPHFGTSLGFCSWTLRLVAKRGTAPPSCRSDESPQLDSFQHASTRLGRFRGCPPVPPPHHRSTSPPPLHPRRPQDGCSLASRLTGGLRFCFDPSWLRLLWPHRGPRSCDLCPLISRAPPCTTLVCRHPERSPPTSHVCCHTYSGTNYLFY